MSVLQYKSASSGSWVDVPSSAVHGTLAGTIEVVYPKAESRTGAGRPCAAVGHEQLLIKSALMTASGMQFWQSRFSTTNAVDTEFWLTGRDPRSGVWNKYTGWLLRPTWSRVQVGSGSLNTLYNDVEIILDLLTAGS